MVGYIELVVVGVLVGWWVWLVCLLAGGCGWWFVVGGLLWFFDWLCLVVFLVSSVFLVFLVVWWCI